MRPATARLALAACLTLLGCDGAKRPAFEYMPDMAHSLAYDSFAPNAVTRDGKTLQRPVPGTVPRGFLPLHYRATPDDALRAGRELHDPLTLDAQSLARGQALYESFCLVCHGASGRGDGPLVPKIPNPPSYASEHVRRMPPGQVFHVITWGSGRLPGYAAQIPSSERWLVVRYVRALGDLGTAQP